MMGGVLGIIGLWPVILRGESVRIWAVVAAGIFVAQALFLPASLQRLYRGWMTFGHAIGWVNTRILLGLVFYGLVTPMGWVVRMVSNDPMRRAFDPTCQSYRVPCTTRPGHDMKNQF